MSYHIRKYQPTDREQLRNICHATATAPNYVENPELVATMYSDYYTDHEPDGIFVLARDVDDIAVGYIYSAKDTKIFLKVFKKEYLGKVKSMNKGEAFGHTISSIMGRIDAKKYPAHLHIDILPEAQHKGYGTLLMDALISFLKEQGVKGVHLGVGGDNVGAISFYTKYGFLKIHDFNSLGKIFAMRLDK